MEKSKTEYLFKVNLKGARRIWRTITVRGGQTLEDLHEAIFIAFDRFDEHLYSFYFPRARRSRGPTPARLREYTAPVMLEDPEPADNGSRLNAADTRLDALGLKVGQQFEYLFDFGDCWWHEIKVEQIQPAGTRKRLSFVVEKHGKSPPQYPPTDEG